MKQRQHVGSSFLVVLLMLIISTTPAQATKIIDRIVAVVNEDIILLSELNKRMKPYDARIGEQGYDKEKERQIRYKVREDMLNRLVDEKLTDQEIKRNDVQVDEAQIDEAIKSIKTANYFTDEDLRQFLAQENMTMEQYREQIREQILRTRLVNYEVKSKIVITEEDIKAFYDDHPELYGGKLKYHLRNILLRVPEFATSDEKEASRQKMADIRAKLLAGESFADMARIYSESPVASDGGDIGDFSKETLSPQIQDALEGLEAGQNTEVLDTDQGFQIFYIEAINREADKPLESVAEEIRQKLYKDVVDKKFQSWLEDLRRHSHIKIIN